MMFRDNLIVPKTISLCLTNKRATNRETLAAFILCQLIEVVSRPASFSASAGAVADAENKSS